MTNYTTVTSYNNKDDDDVHLAEIKIGQKLRGSIVTNLKVDVVDDDEKYKIKKHITLLNGIILISLYIKTKAEGLSDLEKVGEVSMDPVELLKLQKLNEKDDSDLRAKAREAMAKRKNGGKPTPKTTFGVHVRTPEGKVLPLKGIKPTDTVADIKKKIEEKSPTDYPVKDQKLSFQNKPLDNPTSTMDENGIKDGSVLDLLEIPFDLKVNTPNNGVIDVKDVKPNDTVKDIKNKIKDQTGTPINDQKLVYQGKPLNDPKSTMKDNNIKQGSTLDLLEPTFDIQVKTPNNGKTIDVKNIKSSDTVEDIKKKILEQEGIPIEDHRLLYKGNELSNPNSTMKENGIQDGSVLDMIEPVMTVNVMTPDGSRKIQLDNAKKTDTVNDIKLRILETENIPVNQQRLIYKGKELVKSKKTMEELGIKDGDTLNMLDPLISVKVVTPDGTKTIQLNDINVKTDTVQDIKKKIEKLEGIPKKEQRLVFNGEELTGGNDTMEDIGIKDGTILNMLEPMFAIKVQTPDGRTIPIDDVNKNDTVETLKERIAQELDIPVVEQRLCFGNVELNDPTKTMNDLGIKEGSKLTLKDPFMSIKVKTPDNMQTIKLDNVKKIDTIKDIKERIAKDLDIPVLEQRLFFSNELLEDPNATLDDVGIKNGNILELKPTIIKVVKADGKSTFDVPIKSGDTIQDLKYKIEDIDGTPVDLQRLFFEDKPLPNVDEPDELKGLWDFGLHHGSTIHMKPLEVFARTPSGVVLGPFKVTPSNTLMDLKQLIMKEKSKDVPATSVKDLRLLKQDGDDTTPLDDDTNMSMKDIGIQHGDIVDICPMIIKVNVPTQTQADEPVELNNVTPYDTIKDIKKKLKEQIGVPVSQQCLKFDGNELDNEKLTLEKCKIVHGSTLDLDDTIQIKVRTIDGTKKTIPISAKPYDTIQSIKQQLENLEGIPLAEQCLMNGKTVLNDDSSKLSDNKIKNGTILDLVSNKMQIYVKDWNGKKTLIKDVEKDTLIADIHEKIEEEFSIPIKEQFLVYDNQNLDDPNKTLGDYGIVNDSIINLEKFKVFVKTPNGKFMLSKALPTSTIAQIKDMIQTREGLTPKQQLLSFNDKSLDDDCMSKTLKECGIQHKSIIFLDRDDSNLKEDTPEYDINLGDWQSSFGFVSKDKKERIGKRKKKPLGQYY